MLLVIQGLWETYIRPVFNAEFQKFVFYEILQIMNFSNMFS